MAEPGPRDRPAPTRARGTRSGPPAWLIVAVAITLFFLVAAGWQWWRLRGATSERDAARTELAFARLEATLAAAAIEAHEGSWEVSRQYASAFFTGLQDDLDRTPRQARPTLEAILRQRDDVITQLTRGDPQTALLLSRMLGQYRQAVGSPERVRPTGEGAAPPPAP